MSSFYPKASPVSQRATSTQELVIPFTITHSATPSTKVLASDEPSILYIQTEGLTQISSTSGALDSGEATPTFDLAASDTGGNFNLLVNVNPGGLYSYPPVMGDIVKKILSVGCKERNTGASFVTYVNSSAAPLSANADQMLVNVDTAINLATTDLNGVLTITYICNE